LIGGMRGDVIADGILGIFAYLKHKLSGFPSKADALELMGRTPRYFPLFRRAILPD